MNNMYRIAFKYNLPEWGDVELPAPNKETAEDDALVYIKDTYPDITDLEITSIEEIV